MRIIPILARWIPAMLWLGLCLSPGCKGDSQQYTMDYQIKKAFGYEDSKRPEVIAAQAFDESDPDVRRQAIEQLSHKSWALQDPYLKRFAVLTDPKLEKDASVRAVAVRTLGKAGNRKYQPEIVAALDDPSAMVRQDAAVVLTHMPDDKAVNRLRSLAIDADEPDDVRAAAATALSRYRTNPVYKTLLRCLDDRSFNVRVAAHDSLVALTGQDRGMYPENWAGDPEKLGQETLPEPVVRYKKRPWWDWMKVTSETERIQQAPESPGTTDGEESPKPKTSNDRPWWDWFGTTDDES